MITGFTEKFGEGSGIRRIGFETRTSQAVFTATATLTHKSGQLCQLDASGGIFTIYLPANPYDGEEFHFSENAGSATAVTIDGNGKNINGAGTLAMAAAYLQKRVRYNGTQWICVG